MTIVTHDHVHQHEPFQFSTEASNLRLKPGQWPSFIRTDMGNGLDFLLRHYELRDGEMLWCDYIQANGCITLRVFND
jgi:hypothetical protein